MGKLEANELSCVKCESCKNSETPVAQVRALTNSNQDNDSQLQDSTLPSLFTCVAESSQSGLCVWFLSRDTGIAIENEPKPIQPLTAVQHSFGHQIYTIFLRTLVFRNFTCMKTVCLK